MAKLFKDMNVQEKIEHLQKWGSRDQFVRFIVDHHRLRDSSLHPLDLAGFEGDVSEVIDMILERGVANGREFERRELLDRAAIPGGVQ